LRIPEEVRRNFIAPPRSSSAWVPDDLPKVAVRIAEVAGVDPPRSVVGWCDCRARGRRGLQ
jgi:hypothetical protein